MFGLHIITDEKLNRLLRERETLTYQKTMENFIDMLRMKDKVFIGQVTVDGNISAIENCAFFGTKDSDVVCLKI